MNATTININNKHNQQPETLVTVIPNMLPGNALVQRQSSEQCLHNKGVAPDELEPVHARHIAGFNQAHEQHALRPACPVLISLHHNPTQTS